jgi:hypothetical protein
MYEKYSKISKKWAVSLPKETARVYKTNLTNGHEVNFIIRCKVTTFYLQNK